MDKQELALIHVLQNKSYTITPDRIGIAISNVSGNHSFTVFLDGINSILHIELTTDQMLSIANAMYDLGKDSQTGFDSRN